MPEVHCLTTVITIPQMKKVTIGKCSNLRLQQLMDLNRLDAIISTCLRRTSIHLETQARDSLTTRTIHSQTHTLSAAIALPSWKVHLLSERQSTFRFTPRLLIRRRFRHPTHRQTRSRIPIVRRPFSPADSAL